jgi:DMSO/TMAO reductase YedYZ molybdopterin-dependent catalytic subunit
MRRQWNQSNITRRELFRWLGNATVLTLTPDLLNGCNDNTNGTNREPTAVDATFGSGGGTNIGAKFSFEPSPVIGEIFEGWQGNSVETQDLNEILKSWSLIVGGLVENAVTLSFKELISLPRQDQTTDFHCVEGWSVFDVPWNGIHMNRLIELVHPLSNADHVAFYSVGDVYRESLPLAVARESKTMLAYGIAGSTLPLTHGFPLRLVVPRLFGYKSAKWVNRIEFTDTTGLGYWEQFGYSYDAEVPVSRLREGKY